MTIDERRQILTSKMNELIAEGKDCLSCSGLCCTYEFNSMKITPKEAQLIKSHLFLKDGWNEVLKEKLQNYITEFRLNKVFLMKKGNSIRRTYTCPFYEGKNLGCSLTVEVKPLGCLAFNPKEKKVSKAGLCGVYEGGSGFEAEDTQTIPEALLKLF